MASSTALAPSARPARDLPLSNYKMSERSRHGDFGIRDERTALPNPAAADIADLSRAGEQVAGARIRAQLSRPVRVRASLLAHWAIDACVLAGFAYGAWTLAQPR